MTDKPPVNPHRSPTLRHCERHGLDGPEVLVSCVDCPAGIWYRTQGQVLTCFCTVFHRPMWLDGIDAIFQCDGREAAIARVIREKAAQPPR